MLDMPGFLYRAGLGPDVATFEETDKTFMAEDMGFLQGEQHWLHCTAGLGPDAVKYQDIDKTFVAEDMGFLQGELPAPKPLRAFCSVCMFFPCLPIPGLAVEF